VARLGRVHLEAGKPAILHVDYSPRENSKPNAVLEWSKVDLSPSPEAIEAAKNADVVIAVLGITSELEGEEDAGERAGFKGGDRTSLDLPSRKKFAEGLNGDGQTGSSGPDQCSVLAVNWG